jgi:hypothetical protein
MSARSRTGSADRRALPAAQGKERLVACTSDDDAIRVLLVKSLLTRPIGLSADFTKMERECHIIHISCERCALGPLTSSRAACPRVERARWDARRRGVAWNKGTVGAAVCVRIAPGAFKAARRVARRRVVALGEDDHFPRLGDRLKLSFDVAEVLLLTALRTGVIRELHGARAAHRRHVAQLVGRRSSIDHGVRGEVSASPAMAAMAVVLGVGASISMVISMPWPVPPTGKTKSSSA